jgi:hypothetical protein
MVSFHREDISTEFSWICKSQKEEGVPKSSVIDVPRRKGDT